MGKALVAAKTKAALVTVVVPVWVLLVPPIVTVPPPDMEKLPPAP
jgi:hypothetical protein